MSTFEHESPDQSALANATAREFGTARPTYGLKITMTRSDLPGIELTIEMPEVGREHIEGRNPALAAAFRNFDEVVARKR